MTAFEAHDYWIKGRLFINRALEATEGRSEDERRLWASLALEILAKWALAKHSPALVADPEKGGGSELFKALGLKEATLGVSVSATTAFKRCEMLYRHFSVNEAVNFSSARNEYLHGTAIELLNLPGDAWWSRYWSLVVVLLTAHNAEVEDLVGSAHVRGVETHLARNAKRVEHQVKTAIAAAQISLKRYEQGLMMAQETRRWEAVRDLRAQLRYAVEVECPSCHSFGTAESDLPNGEEVLWPDDPDDPPTVLVRFLPDYFSCPNCHLVLRDYDLVEEAGLADEREVEVDADEYDWEPDYGND